MRIATGRSVSAKRDKIGRTWTRHLYARTERSNRRNSQYWGCEVAGGHKVSDIAGQTCRDTDRLDLGPVGISQNPDWVAPSNFANVRFTIMKQLFNVRYANSGNWHKDFHTELLHAWNQPLKFCPLRAVVLTICHVSLAGSLPERSGRALLTHRWHQESAAFCFWSPAHGSHIWNAPRG